MKINTKTKKIFWIIIGMIILAIIVYFGYNYYKQNQEIQSMNKIEFSFLKCISNCPVVHAVNKSSIKSSCVANCASENKVSAELQKKYSEKQLIKDYDYASCVNKIDVRDSMTYEKYQNCLIDIFPKLQEKYSYLKD